MAACTTALPLGMQTECSCMAAYLLCQPIHLLVTGSHLGNTCLNSTFASVTGPLRHYHACWMVNSGTNASLPGMSAEPTFKGPFAVSARPCKTVAVFSAHVSPGRQRVCEKPHHRISQARPQILAAVVLVQQVGPISAMASHQQDSVMAASWHVQVCHARRHCTWP